MRTLIVLCLLGSVALAADPLWRNVYLTVESVDAARSTVVGIDSRDGEQVELCIPTEVPISRLKPSRHTISLTGLAPGDALIARCDVSGETPRVVGVRVTTPAPRDSATPQVKAPAAPVATPAPPPPPPPLPFTSIDIDPNDVPWRGEGRYRVLLEAPPMRLDGRTVDEAPAAAELDIAAATGRAIDVSSIQVMRFDPNTGQPEPYNDWAPARSAHDRPYRWYDGAVPFEHPDVLRPLSRTENRPIVQLLPGVGHSYNPIGDGRSGRLAFMHTQRGSEPAYYAIYFDLQSAVESPAAGPRGWLGDGQIRCVPEPTHTFATSHVRIDLTDMNRDGLLDIVAGEQYGQLMWLPNIGTKQQPRFDAIRLIEDPNGTPLDIGIHAAPHVVDWDGDGTLDLLVGTYVNRIALLRGVAGHATLRFEFADVLRLDGAPLELPYSPIRSRDAHVFKHDYYPVLQAIDVDADGDRDLLAAGYVTGRIYLYENTGRADDGLPQLAFRGPLEADGAPINVSDWCASVCAADLDGDDLPDLLSGAHPMTPEGEADFRTLRYYHNVGQPGAWRFTEAPFPATGDLPHATLATPRSADLNADGLPDIVMSAGSNIWILPNVGSADEPEFDAQVDPIQPSWGPGRLPGHYFVDYDRDGRADMVAGYRVYLRNESGNPYTFGDPISILPDDQTIRHDSGRGDDWFWPRVADFDQDGDFDILFGDWHGYVWLHENRDGEYDLKGVKLKHGDGRPLQVGPLAGAAEATDFTKLQGARTVFVVGDFDGDGVNDLVLGDTFGDVYYTRNTGSGADPVFAERTKLGSLNLRCLVDATDWDGDGRLDVLAGSANGRVRIFLNTGSRGAASFAEGVDPGLPPIKQPRVLAVDLNGDGDEDLFSPSTMGSVWVERSFLRDGYVPARQLDLRKRPEDTP